MDDILVIDGYNRLLYNDVYLPDYATTSSLTNVVMGKNCEITAGTIIGGSTKIRDMSWTGLNSTLKDNIKIEIMS
jgi:bifunctional N-acetylglucosamine-1-phosphate-uridyltransferase/glucosamine-1-phosphate-acetyltransferase GlmU-like protein